MKESSPLKWPLDWPRTLPERQQVQAQWKKSQSFYIDALELELKRMGTVSSVLTLNTRGDRDTGVAVWFSRTKKEDFSWRDILQIRNPYPTIDEIDSAYRVLARRYHTDNLDSADVEVFHQITKARQTARDWVNRREGNSYDYAIACDTFKDVRLNIAALANTIRHIRGIERCGTSALMEKTFEGFKQIAAQAETHVEHATTA